MFSQKQIQEFKEAFGIIDVDKDGIITANDLKAAFVSIGRPISDAEANNLVGEAPGPINFTQMVTLFAEKMAGGKNWLRDCLYLMRAGNLQLSRALRTPLISNKQL